MNRRGFLIGTAGLAGALTISASAITTSTVERDVDIEVVKDDSADAALRLDTGPAGGTEMSSSGQLVITGEDGGYNITPSGEFTFGDEDDPTEEYAFTITNNLVEDRELATVTSTDSIETTLEIELFDESGDRVGSSFTSERVAEDVTTPFVDVDATVPEDATLELTIFEDTSGDEEADNEETISIDDGENSYELGSIELDEGNEIWFEADAEIDDDSDDEDEVEIHEIEFREEDEIEGGQDDVNTSVGETFVLEAGTTVYGIVIVDTETDENVNGVIEINSAPEIDTSSL